MSGNFENFAPNKRIQKAMSQPYDPAKPKRKGHFSDKPGTHGGGSVLLSWIGGGILILGLIIGAISLSPVPVWVLGGLAVQCWIVAMIIRPIEAVWTLLNDRLPKQS